MTETYEAGRCHPECAGWDVFNEEEIQKCDACAIFEDDIAAVVAALQGWDRLQPKRIRGIVEGVEDVASREEIMVRAERAAARILRACVNTLAARALVDEGDEDE